MAKKAVHPNDWIATVVNTVDGDEVVDGITIPLAALPEASVEEGTVATGDIRKVALAFCEEMYQVYATTATNDRPNRMTIENVASTLVNGNERREYRFIFETAGPGLDVVAE
jgi:hypothetical protein